MSFYLALREPTGATSNRRIVDFTDLTKYRIAAPGWQPNTATLNENGTYDLVEERIAITVIGATPQAVYENLRAITNLLEQAQRFANGEQVYPIVLDYVPYGGMRVLTARITSWLADGYLPEDYNHVIVTTCKVTITVGIIRTGEWLFTRWQTENQLAGSAWETNPSFTPINGTIGYTAPPALGQAGVIRLTKSNSGNAAMHAAGVAIAATSGVPIKIRFTAVSTGLTSYQIQLVTGGIAAASSVATLSGSGDVTAVVIPSTTATLLLYWTAIGPAASTLDISKVLVAASTVDDDDLTWHRTYSEENTTATSAAANNPSIHSVNFPTVYDAAAPMAVWLGGGFDSTKNPTIAASYLLIAPSSSAVSSMFLVDAPTANSKTTAPFASVADAANKAYGGTIQRYSPSTTAKVSTQTAANNFNGGGNQVPGEIAGFAVVRNNSATTSFSLSMQCKDRGGNTMETLQTVVAPGSLLPRVIPLGSLWSEDGFAYFEIFVQASAASGTFDIDYLAFVRVQPGVSIVAIDAATPLPSGSNQFVVLDPALLTHRQARVAISGASTPVASQNKVSYRGDVRRLRNRYAYNDASVNTVAALWLAPYSNYWVHVDDGTVGDPISQIQLLATRQPAFVIPE